MMGLMVLVFFSVYFAISLWVIFAVLNWAAKHKRSGWWGVLAAFMMYNLVFWDWIPTLVMHKYYCATQAGFWVYKTPEQWMKENPEVTAEDLTLLGQAGKGRDILSDFHERKPLISNPKKEVLMINQRIYLDSLYEKNINKFVPIHKLSTFFADINNDQKLTEEITFGSGYGGPSNLQGFIKGWLENSTCSNSSYVRPPKLDNFINQIFELRK